MRTHGTHSRNLHDHDAAVFVGAPANKRIHALRQLCDSFATALRQLCDSFAGVPFSLLVLVLLLPFASQQHFAVVPVEQQPVSTSTKNPTFEKKKPEYPLTHHKRQCLGDGRRCDSSSRPCCTPRMSEFKKVYDKNVRTSTCAKKKTKKKTTYHNGFPWSAGLAVVTGTYGTKAPVRVGTNHQVPLKRNTENK